MSCTSPVAEPDIHSKDVRIPKGQPPRDTDLLLRDMLYLLQGIDGKYARFFKKSRFEKQKELNPYLVDKTMPRPGARDDKGKGKQVLEDLADDEEIRGIDFVDPDGQVRHLGDGGHKVADNNLLVVVQRHYVSPSLQMIIVQLAELGVLYRRVFNYIQSKQDPSIQDPQHEASMTEQVSREELPNITKPLILLTCCNTTESLPFSRE